MAGGLTAEHGPLHLREQTDATPDQRGLRSLRAAATARGMGSAVQPNGIREVDTEGFVVLHQRGRRRSAAQRPHLA